MRQYDALCAPRTPGETRVLYFGGDYVHNGVAQERYIREAFIKTGWRMFFVQASRFVTPEVLAGTDLFMLNRVGDFDAQGFSADGIVEHRPAPDPFLTPVMENAVIDNVRERGMGLMALHCTAGNIDNTRLMELIGIRPAKSGAPLQPVRLHGFDPDHAITRGFDEIVIGHDEVLVKEIADARVTRLFTMTGMTEGGEAPGGWCVERGAGRVVTLMPGHMNDAWTSNAYQEILRRAAFWVMKREYPETGLK